MIDADTQILADLSKHPGWEVLRRVAQTRMDTIGQRLAHDFLTKNNQPDYAELQWVRGVIAGFKFLLDNPDMEARKLEKLVEQQKERDAQGA